MCSILAANRRRDLELVFFENRDRPKELFLGSDVREIEGVVGIYDFRAKSMACGYALRTGVAAGVANILGYIGKKSRGAILLAALEKGKSASDAARKIKEEVSSGEYSSARYVVCDPKLIVSIESFGTRVNSLENRRSHFVVTANHFRSLPFGTKHENSLLREQYMRTLGKDITEDRVLKLATRHRNPAICRHGRTLSSFAVFKKRDERARILYSLREPCKGYSEFVPES